MKPASLPLVSGMQSPFMKGLPSGLWFAFSNVVYILCAFLMGFSRVFTKIAQLKMIEVLSAPYQGANTHINDVRYNMETLAAYL
jgi:hypothetical protein